MTDAPQVATIGVGPFVVEAPIARGGMGEVWSGKHRVQGFAVAVKFLTESGFRREGYLQAFRAEARAVAALSHPNIVRVHGWGEVGAPAAAASDGRIPEGAPWLAFDLVNGGTLAPLAGRLAWQEIAAVVNGLLAALAHAHARGVIHRDLKPSNVLVHRDAAFAPFTVKLTDFGLAKEVESVDVDSLAPFRGGTPAYMAPERFDGRWRDDGPWTDLYSAGCLFWALLHGQPPFGIEGTFDHKRRQHQQQPLPPFLPATTVPIGLDRWLGRLLEKDPALRYRRAADAAYAFSLLGSPDAATPTRNPTPPSSEITLVLGERTHPREPPTDPMDGAATHSSLLTLASRALDVPPIPTDWRTPGAPGEHTSRVLERARLWRQLRLAAEDRMVHGALILGNARSGKSELGDWLTSRAHEAGVAHVLRAGHGPLSNAGDGLGAAMRSLFRCQGLTFDAARERIAQILRRHGNDDPVVTETLADLAAPEGRAHSGPSDERGALRAVLEILASERPVVVWLDDVHHGIPSLRFAAWLAGLDPPAPLPVLLLLAADPAGLTVGTVEEALAAAFAAHPRVATIEV